MCRMNKDAAFHEPEVGHTKPVFVTRFLTRIHLECAAFGGMQARPPWLQSECKGSLHFAFAIGIESFIQRKL